MWIFGQTLWTKKDCIFRSTHLCWLHTMPEWERHCQPTSCLADQARRHQLKHGGCWVGKVQIKQLGRCLMWLLWLWHGNDAPVVTYSVCVLCIGQRGRLFGASVAASNDRPWDNYRYFASFLNRQSVGLCIFVELLLLIQSVPVSKAPVRPWRATAWPRNKKCH